MPLPIYIKGGELYDESTSSFIQVKDTKLVLEHSLLSISKWEMKWHIPFLDDKIEKTKEQILYYFYCMVVSPKEIDQNIFRYLTYKQQQEIAEYIKNPMSATTFNIPKHKRNKEIITSELIYYWMAGNQIPFECEKWHINRLLNLIQICGIKNDPKAAKKMAKKDILAQNDKLNDIRRAKLKTKG